MYEARGNYQINVQKVRPKGLGSLMAQFEELKLKLQSEGLFNEEIKKQIPLLPSRIAVITSPEGAAVRDFLNVIERRFSNIHIRILIWQRAKILNLIEGPKYQSTLVSTFFFFDVKISAVSTPLFTTEAAICQ